VEGECTAGKEWVVEVVICKDEGDTTSEQDMVGEEDLVAQWVKVSNRVEDEEHMAKVVGNEVVTLVPVIDPPVLVLLVQ